MADRASRRSGPGRAELATRRLFAVSSAVLALIIVVLALLLMMRDADWTLPAWFGVIATAAAAAFLVTGMLAPWLSDRGLRIGAVLSSGGYLVMLATFLPAAQEAHAFERIPWMLTAAGAAILSGLVAGGTRAGWVVLVAAALGTMLARFEAGGLDEHGLANDAQMVLSGVVICVISGHLLASARQLDDAAATASAAFRRASAESGRLAARTRAASLVHDEVLATLNFAGSGLPLPPERLAAQARRAAEMVGTLADEEHRALPLAAALEKAARSAGARFVHADAGMPVLEPPVREALEGAAQQALDNSCRHAGPGARRSVELITDHREVAIEIVDDGAGFDPEAVPDDRLGVRTSILARMTDVGGTASVDARPAGGVRVRLRWGEQDVALAAGQPSRGLTAGLIAIAVVFVVGQTSSAVMAAFASPLWWPPLVILAAILGAAEVLRLSREPVPSTRRTALFVALTVGTVAAGLPVVPYTFGTLWFAAAAAFLLLALALRARPGWALTGVGGLMAVVIAGGLLAGAPALTIAQVAARPLVVVVLGVCLLWVVDRMQQRTHQLHREALTSTQRRAWDEAARTELAARAADLDRRVVPLLERIAADRPLDDATRRQCIALEGALRDEYRAGALAREPLTTAAKAARERGVDVVLLDDADTRPADETLEEIAAWMASAIAGARAAVVGRLLPAGREAAATVTVDGRTTRFGGRPAPETEGSRLT